MRNVESTLPGLRDVVVDAFPLTFSEIAASVRPGWEQDVPDLAPKARALAMLKLARQRGWLEELLTALEEHPDAPARKDLLQAIDRVREATGAVSGGWYREPQNVWNTHFVREGGVANRDELRRYIQGMT